MGSKQRQELLKIKALSARDQLHPHHNLVGTAEPVLTHGVTSSGIPFYRRPGSRISLVPVLPQDPANGDHP